MYSVISPFPQFTDLDGSPLNSGNVYIGTAGLNPVTNPVAVYWDSAGTIPASQPIRTLNGYFVRNGAAANVYAPFDYSMTVKNKRFELIYSTLSVQSEFKFREEISVKEFGAVGDSDGTTGNGTDDTAAIQAAIDYAFASSMRPRSLFFPDGYYRVTGTLTIPSAHWKMFGESHRVIIWCDHDSVGLQVTSCGNYNAKNFDVRRVTGKTGVGVSLLSSPEGEWEDVYFTNHSNNIQIQDSHLTTLYKCRFSGASGTGVLDLGRCFASGMIECNVIGNAVGADLKSDWKIVGGAIEQNTVSDLYVSTTADYEGKYWGWVNISAGCHMEGLSGGTITTDQIVVGPAGASVAGPTAKIGLMLSGSFILGNSATRNAINFRQGDLCSVTNNYFKDYLAGSTMITCGAATTGGVFQGNRWDGTGTFKNINASATNVLNFESENTTHLPQFMSITHSSTNGGRIRSVNALSSAARDLAMLISSYRNVASTDAITIRTVGADLATQFSRIAISGGADIGLVDINGARLKVAGSYTSPMLMGTMRLWVNGGALWFKDGSDPTSIGDGAPV